MYLFNIMIIMNWGFRAKWENTCYDFKWNHSFINSGWSQLGKKSASLEKGFFVSFWSRKGLKLCITCGYVIITLGVFLYQASQY